MIVLLFIVFVLNVNAQSIVALLKGIENNHELHMVYNQKAFVCKPYGVESVSELILRIDANSTCITHLDAFRRNHPYEKFFAQMSLYVQQQYSVEGKGDRCLLYLSNEGTYSEALLEKGYARIPLGLQYDDIIMKYRFKKALQRAKSKKLGIWSDVNVRNCFLGE